MDHDLFPSDAPQPLGAKENLAIASLTLALLSFLSPQIGVLGRGLRTAIPALVVAFLAISLTSRQAFLRALMRFRIIFILGFFFLAQAFLRFALETGQQIELVHRYLVGPILGFVFLLWIAALAEFGEEALHRMRCWLLFGWCLSFAVSLPVLMDNPGVARLTMGNSAAAMNAARWAPFGVSEYTGYTTIAICLAPLLGLLGKMNRPARWFSLVLVVLTTLAVFFSTFTMASVMAMASLFSMLLIWTLAGRGMSRIYRLLVMMVPFVLVPTLFMFANNFEQTRFVVTKAERLTKNISNKGLAKGDETERGAWFTEELSHFTDEPFLGYLPGITGVPGHGHSSFSNSLVLFGLFGTLLWLATLYKVFKISFDLAWNAFERQVLTVGWIVFILSGILNPIWYSTATLAALFALTLPARTALSLDSSQD